MVLYVHIKKYQINQKIWTIQKHSLQTTYAKPHKIFLKTKQTNITLQEIFTIVKKIKYMLVGPVLTC